MKKFLALAIIAVMTVALFAVGVNAADPVLVITAEQIASSENNCSAGVESVELKTDDGNYARITSAGDDPWIQILPTPTTEVANKYAAIKYRSTSEKSTGIEIYTEIAEPHATTSEAFQNDGQWHTIVIDLSTAAAQWKGNFSRLDPMNAAGLPAGEVIDIAWIALFASEDDAKSYTGTDAAAAGASVVQPWFDNFAADGAEFWARGWVIIAGDDIEDIGYSVDGKDPVFSSLVDRSAEVSGVMGSDPAKTNGFDVKIAAADLPAGEHTVSVIVKTKGGELLKVNKDEADTFTFVGTGSEAEPETQPPATADAAVIAIAAVACVALAGVVIAKKVK